MKKSYVMAQYLAQGRQFQRRVNPELSEASSNEIALADFEVAWQMPLLMVPGKEALSELNAELQNLYGVSVTPAAIIDAMHTDEVPTEARDLLETLASFTA